jgi:anti-sigma28 factor (negative regulator of flagellin synthesis)
MRIEDNTAANIYRSGAAGAAPNADWQSRSEGANGLDTGASDLVNLSDAANLVSLARQTSSPDRQARVSGVIAQVRSGQYQVDGPEVGRALIQGHLTG